MDKNKFKQSNNFSREHESFVVQQEIVINNNCDLNCLFCSVDISEKNNQRIFSFDLQEIIEKLTMQKQVSDAIRITGGEPTLHPKLAEIIKNARRIGFTNICIETNGQNFSDEIFAKKIVESGAKNFLISIHGDTASLHEKLTGTKKSFKRTTEGIRNLIKIGANVDTNVVISKINYKHIADTVKLLVSLGVPHITLSFVTVNGAVIKNKKLVPRIGEVVKYLKKISKEHLHMVTLQHMPFCLLGELNRVNNWIKHEDKKVLYTPSYKITFERIIDSFGFKSKKCSRCKFDNICYGLDNGYYKLFGSREIKPQPGDKFKDVNEYKNYGTGRH
jgi:MoaA/NifB/PqqE/SkfB family radical SAM enzyme